MKNNYLILLLIAVLFLSSCKPDLSDERIKTDPVGVMNDCSQAPDNEQIFCYNKISEVLQKINPDKAFQACSGIKEDNSKKGCFESLYKAQEDAKIKLNLCKKINIPELNRNCLEDVANELQTINPELAFQACSALPDAKVFENSPQGDCVEALVKSQNNTDIKLNLCRKVQQDWLKNCIEIVAYDEQDSKKAVEVCNEFKDDQKFREHCYAGIISNSESVDINVKLSMCAAKTGTDKDNCYRSASEELQITQPAKSVELCKKISDLNTKNSCLNNFIGSPELIKANPTLAVSICGSLTLKSNCYNNVARTLSGTDPKQAAAVCQKLSDDVQISDCYGNVWFAFNDIVVQNYDFTISLCNILALKKVDCLRRASSAFTNVDKTKAEAICKLITDSSSSGCLQEVQ